MQVLRRPESVLEFLNDASGPFSSLNGMIAFEKVPQSFRRNFSTAAVAALNQFPADWPEVEYATRTSAGPDGAGIGVILVSLQAPVSRGSVTIASADISAPPVIDIGWLTDPAGVDAQVAVAAFKRARRAFDSLSEINVGPELAPGPAVQSDEDILTYIRNTTATFSHAGATCAMGKMDDPNAVVDSQARVFGVQRLRVVDLSAVPFTPPGHPQATVYMLAEKIADVIKKTRVTS